MSRLLSILITLFLALWAGSLVHLVLTVSSLFRAFPKAVSSVALEAAPRVFWVTERYHLAISILSVICLVAWRLFGCCRSKRWMTAFLVLATLLAFVQVFGLSSKMDELREDGPSARTQFTNLHRWSTRQYAVQTTLVLGAVCLLPAAISGRCALDKAPGSSPA